MLSKAYQLEALKRAGINVSRLGCIMLDVKMPDVAAAVRARWAYQSTDPAHWWVSGVQDEGHVTLLYGLLPDLVDRAAVDEVLAGWVPPVVESTGFEVFPSPFPDEPYECVVARVDDSRLLDAHQRLSLLPHINTYPDYKAHVTLAYVKKGTAGRAIDALTHMLGGRIMFPPARLNYGNEIGRTG